MFMILFWPRTGMLSVSFVELSDEYEDERIAVIEPDFGSYVPPEEFMASARFVELLEEDPADFFKAQEVAS